MEHPSKNEGTSDKFFRYVNEMVEMIPHFKNLTHIY